MSNFKQIGLGIMMYTQDYDGYYPMTWYGRKTAGTPGSYTQTKSGYPGSHFGFLDPSGGSGSLGHWISWMDMIYPYVESTQLFVCPSHTRNEYGGYPVPDYWMNGAYGNTAKETLDSTDWTDFYSGNYGLRILNSGTPMAAIVRPAETVMVFEMMGDHSQWGIMGSPSSVPRWSNNFDYHLGGSNIVFGDGHVKWKSIATMVAETGPYYNGGRCNLNHNPPTPIGCNYCSRAWNPFMN